MDWLSRTELLLGEERLGLLKKAHVLVAGLGGVGAYAAEQLCRAGIGEMTIIDGDCVDVTNKNRQLPALDSNIGKAKAEIMAIRFRDINLRHQLQQIKRDRLATRRYIRQREFSLFPITIERLKISSSTQRSTSAFSTESCFAYVTIKFGCSSRAEKVLFVQTSSSIIVQISTIST